MKKTTRVQRLLPCILTSAALLALSTASARAQDTTQTHEGRGYVTVGMSTLDLGQLNDRLASHGYPRFPEHRLSIGVGAHGIRGQWLFGIEGQGLIGRTKDALRSGPSLETSLNGGSGFFNVGYLAMKQDDLHVYPFVGVGGGGIELKISERTIPTFDQVLAAPGRTSSLTSAGLLFQVGVGVDQLLAVRTKDSGGERTTSGFVIGLRAGYVFMPAQSDWMLGSTRVASGPDFGMTGPYVRVIVGRGSRRGTR